MEENIINKLHKGQALWFIDKETSKEVQVTINEVFKDTFTFIYKGKIIKCSKKKIGNGIYKHSKNNAKIFFMGELFFFDEKWKRYDNKIYSMKYQDKLSKLFDKRFLFCKLPTELLIERAREAKDSKKYDIAISYFEIALLKSSICEVSDYISELTSLYRKCHKPNAVIELYKYICKKHKSFYFPNSFLTSLSAAYLDIGNKEKALQFAGEVYGRLGGKKDKELEKIYFRINTYRD